MPITAVLFDFHATLAQVEEPAEWVVKAAAACGVDLAFADATGPAKALVAAGRAGGPFPDAVPAHLADLWERRDTLPVLRALRDAGVKVAMVSNIGFDLRPLSAALGLADLVDAYALSYEVGACKPAPEIFRAALSDLGVAPRDALMVGDTPADAGAAALGCRCLILPASPPDAVHGLRAVLDLAALSGHLGRSPRPGR